jgi:hypothetical protein
MKKLSNYPQNLSNDLVISTSVNFKPLGFITFLPVLETTTR